MKAPLTDEEKRIIKLFSEINPVFDELAKATWPEVFEKKKLKSLPYFIYLEGGAKVPLNFSGKGKINEDEYDV